MRYVADENAERQIVDALRRAGHEVEYIAETAPGATDPEVLERANRLSAVFITADKDFGELAYRRRQQNAGVVLLRLSGLTQERKAAIVLQIFADHSADFADAFSVVTETGVRVRRQSRHAT